jgi:predicted nucleic acid-binding protein
MPVEPGVIDANVLVYAINVDDLHHGSSRALLDAARDPLVTLYVTSQILCEFYSVITNPRRVALASSAAEAATIIAGLLVLPGLHVLPAPMQAVKGLMELLQRYPVTGSRIFDLQIVATMQANNIQRIYTFNTGDFQKFPELEVIAP